MINTIAESKYTLGRKFIDQQISFMQDSFKNDINNNLGEIRHQLLSELEKKAAVSEFRDELKDIKEILEKMVEESVDSFASKEETKKSLTLFENKILKVEMVM